MNKAARIKFKKEKKGIKINLPLSNLKSNMKKNYEYKYSNNYGLKNLFPDFGGFI